MPITLQSFFAEATEKAADALIKAYQQLPEDKRAWSPQPGARTANDQIAECALINSYMPQTIEARFLAPSVMGTFSQEKAALEGLPWEQLEAALLESTRNTAAAIQAVPDEDLDVSIDLPWGPMPMAEVIANSYWNMSYHQGQITYMASLLGSETP